MRALSLLVPSSVVGERRAVLLQAMRYAIAGGIITLLVAASYWAVATWFHVDANLALGLVFVVFSAVSYVTHGKYSFQDHGTRDRQHIRAVRFFVINLLGFALNQLFVWFFVKHLGGPTWWPIPLIVALTPLITFTLHRRWVYA
jgi:putative flippase GtrA